MKQLLLSLVINAIGFIIFTILNFKWQVTDFFCYNTVFYLLGASTMHILTLFDKDN